VELASLEQTALDVRLGSAAIRQAASGPSRVEYPSSGVAGSLKTVARMIAYGMPTQVYYVSQGGYDTHTTQATRHEQLLEQLGGALLSFVRDLEAERQFDRVAVMVFSEFGRRVKQNPSAGTDHGEAGPMFVIGPALKPGLHGKACSLEPQKLNRGDLAWTTDFRTVYASVLRDWLRTDPGRIVGKAFTPLPIFDRA
jgi:uncharacterized protein (DUF1501 family)